MDFTMHMCASLFKRRLRLLVFSAWLGLSLPVNAAIELLHMADYHADQQLFIDAQARFNLPDPLVQAILHEIPLRFITQVELARQDYLVFFPFKREQVRIDYVTQISYSRFYQRYTLHNLRNNNRQHFSSLAQALDTLGTLNGFHLAGLAQLHPGAQYHIRLRFKLEYWTLPAPMLTQALLDARWRFSSPWFDLPIEMSR